MVGKHFYSRLLLLEASKDFVKVTAKKKVSLVYLCETDIEGTLLKVNSYYKTPMAKPLCMTSKHLFKQAFELFFFLWSSFWFYESVRTSLSDSLF